MKDVFSPVIILRSDLPISEYTLKQIRIYNVLNDYSRRRLHHINETKLVSPIL